MLSLFTALLLTADGGAPLDAGVIEDTEPKTGVHLYAAAEASFTSFPSGTPGGQQDVLADLRPIVGIDVGEDFGVEVGATFRLRLIDDAPNQRANDIGQVLRRADWDEASDFGQILRSIRINQPGAIFWARGGAVRSQTVGLGHLISRYSNQDNPDYHPAGLTLGLGYKAVSAQLFASDLFGARIFAGELVFDLGRIFGNTNSVYDRFHLAFSLAHDAGRAGYLAPSVTLMQMDFDAVLYRNSTTRILALVGLGGRTQDAADPTGDLGLVGGLAIDAMLEGGFSIGGKLELRKQQGGFRQGFFGAGYELARFSDTGFTGLSRTEAQLPDFLSVFGELHIASGQAVSFDFALEHFAFGRTDLDTLFSLEVINHRLIAAARFTATGLGQVPRYAVTSELRVRLFSSFYVMAYGGTVFFPQPDSTLVRGVYGGAGAGVDFER